MSGAKSKLMCLVWPDDKPDEHIVQVEIDNNDTVADLKKLIKDEHASMLSKVASRDLVLWKCSGLPDDDNLEQTLKTIRFDDSDVVRLVRLNKAVQRISQLFGDEDLSKEPIHILVEVPALDSVLASSTAALKRDHDGIGSDEGGGKRHKADSSIVDDGPFQKFGFKRLCVDDGGWSTEMLDFHKQFWGNPLPPEHLDLKESVHDPNDEEHDDENGEENDGDLLPESPIIVSSWSRLLIRAEYLRIYNWVEEMYDEGTPNRPAAVVVTGQPGIGKTYWAYYALRRRLGEKSDTLWFQASESYLFCSEGVLIVPADFLFRKFSSRIWTLIDSSESPSGIPIELRPGVFPIYLTPPTRASWSKLAQSWSDYRAIMNPWTKAEVEYATKSLISKEEISDALQRYDRLGPTARLCLEMTPVRVEAYVNVRDASIAKASPDLFEECLSSFHQENPHDLSHKICLIRRKQGSPLGHADWTIHLISAAVEQQVAKRLEDFSIDQLLGTWKIVSRFIGARTMAGTIFEALVHRKFSTCIKLAAIPMVRSKSTLSRWHALFSTKRPETATIHGAAKKNFPLQVKAPRTFVYVVDTTTKLKIKPDVYYVPQSGQQVAFDSFILSGGYLNLFQCTASHKHTIKDSLVNFLARCSGLPAHNRWRFVFVLPDGLDSFSCPALDNSVLRKIGLYTACISVCHGDGYYLSY